MHLADFLSEMASQFQKVNQEGIRVIANDGCLGVPILQDVLINP
jgi:hypothetical protein